MITNQFDAIPKELHFLLPDHWVINIVYTAMKIACELYNISEYDLLSKCRKKEIILARSTAIALCKDMTDLKPKSIAKAFNMQRSNVLHNLKTFDNCYSTDPKYRKAYIHASIKLTDQL